VKKPIVFGCTLLIAVSVGDLIAQNRPAETERVITDDVTRAAKEAKVEINQGLLEAFADSASSQREAFTRVLSTVPKEVRVTRLASYLAAKVEAKSTPRSASLTANDLGDFHWGYIARDIRYSPMRLESPKTAKLLSVESTDGQYTFGIKAETIKPGAVVLLPAATGQGAANFTVTFDLGDRKALWTGSPVGGQVSVVAAGTSKGCEIFVNSKPPSATVYFNGKEWYAVTNTSAVRDPGTWEVICGFRNTKIGMSKES
jgi:hypothetical protein